MYKNWRTRRDLKKTRAKRGNFWFTFFLVFSFLLVLYCVFRGWQTLVFVSQLPSFLCSQHFSLFLVYILYLLPFLFFISFLEFTVMFFFLSKVCRQMWPARRRWLSLLMNNYSCSVFFFLLLLSLTYSLFLCYFSLWRQSSVDTNVSKERGCEWRQKKCKKWSDVKWRTRIERMRRTSNKSQGNFYTKNYFSRNEDGD